jgi:hypothetical protein
VSARDASNVTDIFLFFIGNIDDLRKVLVVMGVPSMPVSEQSRRYSGTARYVNPNIEVRTAPT